MQPLLAGHEALLRPVTTKRLCKLLAASWLPGMQRSRDRKDHLMGGYPDRRALGDPPTHCCVRVGLPVPSRGRRAPVLLANVLWHPNLSNSYCYFLAWVGKFPHIFRNLKSHERPPNFRKNFRKDLPTPNPRNPGILCVGRVISCGSRREKARAAANVTPHLLARTWDNRSRAELGIPSPQR